MSKETLCVTLLLALSSIGAQSALAHDDPSETPFWAPLPVEATAMPANFIVDNQTEASLRFDVTWGQASPFSAASAEHDFGALGLYEEFLCNCVCGEDCVDCEEPMERVVDIAPGESHAFAWGGYFWRLGQSRIGSCMQPFASLSGEYLVVACTQSGAQCASTTVNLPATDPIRIVFGSESTPPECDTHPEVAERAVRSALGRMSIGSIVTDRHAVCDVETAVCHDDDEEAELGTAADTCELHAWLRDDGVEVLVHLPLPEGTLGGEQYRTWFDPYATRVRRVQYTQ
ncbi:MAG: hypothetical protein KC561_09920 [Myxococcales bacterium]|nr:hypothetical protein [Myxococcales bacterium]